VLFSLELSPAVGVVVIIVQNLAWLAYTVNMHARYGQTYGKMVCKVMVVDHLTEGAISFRQAWLREGIPLAVSLGIICFEIYLVITGGISQGQIARGVAVTMPGFWLLGALPGLWFLAEVITMLTNDKRRALHDYIAGTVVVRTNAN
jgi:uncharacterized RDD family membrane protein YckC